MKTKLKNKRNEIEGLTQKEVAKKANISTRYYQKLERGDSVPNVNLAKKIAEVLGCDIKDIF